LFFAFSRLGLDQSLKKPYVNTDTLACYGGLCDLIEGLIVIENTVISKSSYLDYIVALQKACTYEDIKIDQLQLLQLFLRDKNIFVDFKKVYAQLDELTSGNPFYWIENDNKQKTIKKVSAIHELLESWDDFCMNAMVLQKIVRNLSKEGDRHSPNELKQIHFIHQDMEIKDIKSALPILIHYRQKNPQKLPLLHVLTQRQHSNLIKRILLRTLQAIKVLRRHQLKRIWITPNQKREFEALSITMMWNTNIAASVMLSILFITASVLNVAQHLFSFNSKSYLL
jgi:hypothetical protein